MAILVGIGGETSNGKSTGIKDLNPEETFVISVLGKTLPFKGARKNYTPFRKKGETYEGNLVSESNAEKITKYTKIVSQKMPHIKYIVIDDANYVMSCETMDRASEKGFEKFTETAKHYNDLLRNIESLRPDLIVFILSHTENTGDVFNPKWKLKTTGKMLDSIVGIDGLFTYLLYAEKIVNSDDVIEFKYRTRTLGPDTCKTPIGCFEDLYIDNNLQLVADTINKHLDGE